MSAQIRDSALITEDEARNILNPYLAKLVECIYDGWGRLEELTEAAPGLSAPLTPRTKASYVNDHIWEAVKTTFSGFKDADVIETGGLRTLCIADQIVLRFKKLNRRLRSSNIMTHQQLTFSGQLPLPGIPLLSRVTIGYMLDKLQTKIEVVAVTLPMGKALVWAFVVPAVDTQVTVTPLNQANLEQTRTRKVRVKKAEQDDEARTGND